MSLSPRRAFVLIAAVWFTFCTAAYLSSRRPHAVPHVWRGIATYVSPVFGFPVPRGLVYGLVEYFDGVEDSSDDPRLWWCAAPIAAAVNTHFWAALLTVVYARVLSGHRQRRASGRHQPPPLPPDAGSTPSA